MYNPTIYFGVNCERGGIAKTQEAETDFNKDKEKGGDDEDSCNSEQPQPPTAHLFVAEGFGGRPGRIPIFTRFHLLVR